MIRTVHRALLVVAIPVAGLAVAWMLTALRIDPPVPLALIVWASILLASILVFQSLARRTQRLRLRSFAKVAVRISVGFVGSLAALVAMLLANTVVNQIRLVEFAQRVASAPLPPNTARVAVRKEVGLLTGNGNHCDYVTELTLETELSPETIRAHYESQRFDRAVPGETDGGITVLVSQAAAAPSERSWYAVQVIDAPNEAWLDLRCH